MKTLLFTKVSGSNGSVGDGIFARYSQKSVTLDFFKWKVQFGNWKNVHYSQKNLLCRYYGRILAYK